MPANEMHRLTETIASGETTTNHWSRKNGSLRQGGLSVSKRSSNVQRWYCGPCVSKRRFKTILGIASVGLLGLGALVLGDNKKSSPALNDVVPENRVELPLEDRPLNAELSDTDELQSDLPPDIPADAEQESQPPQAVTNYVDSLDPQAILNATMAALKAGKPQRWESAGHAGYVTVSERLMLSDRQCRNTALSEDANARTMGGSETWCMMAGEDEWKKQPR